MGSKVVIGGAMGPAPLLEDDAPEDGLYGVTVTGYGTGVVICWML